MADLFIDGPGILTNLVSMLTLFVQERRHRKDLDHKSFLEWLDNHQFQELKQIIQNTHDLPREIDQLLLNRQDEILSEIRLVGTAISQIANELKSWKGIAHTVSPKVLLSDQALLILDLAELEETSNLYYMPEHHPYPVLIIGNRGWDAPDPRFLHDDLGDLLSLRLIEKLGTNRDGNPILRLTREGFQFVARMEKRPSLHSNVIQPDSEEKFLFTIKLKKAIPDIDREASATACMEILVKTLSKVGAPNIRSERANIFINIECAELPKDIQQEVGKTAQRFGYSISGITKR